MTYEEALECDRQDDANDQMRARREQEMYEAGLLILDDAAFLGYDLRGVAVWGPADGVTVNLHLTGFVLLGEPAYSDHRFAYGLTVETAEVAA